MNVLAELKNRFRAALAPLTDDVAPLLEMIRPAQDPKFGDYQANCAMPLGKQLGRPPREVAEQIKAGLALDDLCESIEIAGPGFINLRLRTDWLSAQLAAALADERLGIEPVSKPLTYVLDYSSPNVAKPMHVGHIRSTVIGDALYHTLKFLGHNVISDNHLGDWGTQFGMIIYGYRHFVDQEAYAAEPVAELGRIYRQVRMIMDYYESRAQEPQLVQREEQLSAEIAAAENAEPTGDKQADKKQRKALEKLRTQRQETAEQLATLRNKIAAADADPQTAKLIAEHAGISQAVLAETVKLHEGDAENLALWQEFLPKCRQDIEKIYNRLSIRFDHELGESFYHDQLAKVVNDFVERGLARESEGAMCVFLDGFKSPMIIRKQDGAFLYASTDLATIAYRMEHWKPDAILYVVDFRQGEHFEKLFAAAALWGCQDVQLTHVSFGTVLGEDKRPYKTRSGDTVGLEGLLDEAERRAYEIVSQNDDAKPNGPELDEATRRHVARVVGIAAIKYADLSQNRTSDYVFSYDKMLATTGNTATYMQYAYARVRSIFRRGNVDIESLRASGAELLLDHPAERALAQEILRFSESLELMTADYRPNQLTNYLFNLAERYSTFFVDCPVLKADDARQRDSRLLLCDLTARTLKQGLALLGIDVVEQM